MPSLAIRRKPSACKRAGRDRHSRRARRHRTSSCREIASGRRRHPHRVRKLAARRREGSPGDRHAAVGAQAAARRDRQAFIYTSGVWVLGAKQPAGRRRVAARPGDARRLAAGARTARARCRPERRCARSSCGPGIVYGGSRGIVSDLLKDALNGLVRVIGPGKNRWPMRLRSRLADLYVRLLQTPRRARHVSRERRNRRARQRHRRGDRRPSDAAARHPPHATARSATKKLGTYADALALDQRVRSPRARALGWTPSLSQHHARTSRVCSKNSATRTVADGYALQAVREHSSL